MGRSIDTEVGPVSVADFEPGRLTHRVFLGPKFLFAFFNTNDELHEASQAIAEFVRSDDLYDEVAVRCVGTAVRARSTPA